MPIVVTFKQSNGFVAKKSIDKHRPNKSRESSSSEKDANGPIDSAIKPRIVSDGTPARAIFKVEMTTTVGDLANFCRSEIDGNYANPNTCNSFIMCSNGLTYCIQYLHKILGCPNLLKN